MSRAVPSGIVTVCAKVVAKDASVPAGVYARCQRSPRARAVASSESILASRWAPRYPRPLRPQYFVTRTDVA